MIFILKLMLIIISLNETYAYITQNVERILLPALNPTSAEEIPLTLKVFEKQIQLKLRRNEQIVSTFNVWEHYTIDVTEKLSQINASDPCYYLHKDRISTAAINFCQENGWKGFVFLKDDTLEIRPLRDDFATLSLINDLCDKEDINISFGNPHLIKRSLQLSADSSLHNLDNFKLKRRHVENTQNLTVELAVFIDQKIYHRFLLFLNNDETICHSMMLAYVNRIQAMFHHPSLGISIDILLVYLEIIKEEWLNLPINYKVKDLLNSFCKYAETHNPSDDNNPRHWDIGLYLTEINIYSMKTKAVGFSYTDGMCKSNESCAIVNVGIEHESSGFTSSLIAAHEIGHVLGMRHDSSPCDTKKYIMSLRKYYYDQTTWSECSRDMAEELWNTKECLRDRTTPENFELHDHSRYHDLPGRNWTAKAQCEIYFRDKDANVVSLLDICKTLQCETPHKNAFNFTGPALEGTYCAPGKECRGGECVAVVQPPLKYCKDDDWSEWEEGSCQSSCLVRSRDVRIKRRSCRHGSRRTASCEGSYYNVVLCNSPTRCNQYNRISIIKFTVAKCTEFSRFINHSEFGGELELEMGRGIQGDHNVETACTIYCQLKNSSAFYAPRLEMLSLGVDPYFPDGTWCHYKDGQDYYCRQHYCLPEVYS